MTTLFKNIGKNREGKFIIEFVEHNEKKFRLYAQYSNGDPIGFDNYQCIHILTNNGELAPIIDGSKIGVTEYDTMEQIINRFKEFIEKVY